MQGSSPQPATPPFNNWPQQQQQQQQQFNNPTEVRTACMVRTLELH